MTREAVAAVLLMLGGVVVRLTLEGQHVDFVKESFWAPLLLSAAVVLSLGVAALLGERRRGGSHEVPAASGAADGDHVDDGHDHAGHGPRMGLLLAAPLIVLLVVPAAPLGAFAAGNGAANRVADDPIYAELPPPVDGAHELLLTEVVGRALHEPAPLDGASVRTTGFVAPMEGRPGAYLLSRFTIGCCAVDAAPFQVVVDVEDGEVPPPDQWVTAVLRLTDEQVVDGSVVLPVFDLVDQREVPEPDVPYIY